MGRFAAQSDLELLYVRPASCPKAVGSRRKEHDVEHAAGKEQLSDCLVPHIFKPGLFVRPSPTSSAPWLHH
eukprot:1158599-Pelagomonas_calceolata.AAC.8